MNIFFNNSSRWPHRTHSCLSAARVGWFRWPTFLLWSLTVCSWVSKLSSLAPSTLSADPESAVWVRTAPSSIACCSSIVYFLYTFGLDLNMILCKATLLFFLGYSRILCSSSSLIISRVRYFSAMRGDRLSGSFTRCRLAPYTRM